MPHPLFQVDAFTDAPLAGNPAAVVILESPAPQPWMQAVAAEMNLSETAFARSRSEETYELRWFTPTVEVDLCGHATLATAHVLFETGAASSSAGVVFETRSGALPVRAEREGNLVMDFPADPVRRWSPTAEVVAALGCEPVAGFRGGGIPIVELADEAAVRAVVPDFARLAATEPGSAIVTAPSATPLYDFVSRCYGPRFGIAEDPVTGSSHCALGPLWAERLGRSELRAQQVSARGGSMIVRPQGDRVELAGRAVTVLHGELTA
ncbi:MAG: PhzF family phenazine biosynthesis protein [Acidimicrobiia bacterium]